MSRSAQRLSGLVLAAALITMLSLLAPYHGAAQVRPAQQEYAAVPLEGMGADSLQKFLNEVAGKGCEYVGSIVNHTGRTTTIGIFRCAK